MIRFDWNGLAVGDRVVVCEHDRSRPRPVDGIVAFVAKRRKSNDVGIRVEGRGGRVLWPTRHEVEMALADHVDLPRPTGGR